MLRFQLVPIVALDLHPSSVIRCLSQGGSMTRLVTLTLVVATVSLLWAAQTMSATISAETQEPEPLVLLGSVMLVMGTWSLGRTASPKDV